MKLITYTPTYAEPSEFVAFWSQQYHYSLEHLYDDGIKGPLTVGKIHALFEWKNGSRLSALKYRSVEQNYIARLPELKSFPKNTSPHDFLQHFSVGGAIWRIFWLHCWQPSLFPIYDQHVHRAMVFIQTGRLEEIPTKDAEKIDQYLDEYLPFHRQFDGLDSRSVDQALWFYGKFLKGTSFPLLQSLDLTG